MIATVKVGNQGTTSEYYYIVICDGEDTRKWFADPACNYFKTRKGAVRHIIREGMELLK